MTATNISLSLSRRNVPHSIDMVKQHLASDCYMDSLLRIQANELGNHASISWSITKFNIMSEKFFKESNNLTVHIFFPIPLKPQSEDLGYQVLPVLSVKLVGARRLGTCQRDVNRLRIKVEVVGTCSTYRRLVNPPILTRCLHNGAYAASYNS
jgi:hypothetical protein